MSATVLHGDCRALLRSMPADSVSSLVCDPPYGLGKTPPIAEILTRWLAGEDVEASGGGFMGRSWDSFVPGPATWREALRVMKPGAHGVVFAGDRTVDLMAIALRLAGFEIRHVGAWVSAQVFPKSLDVSKAIDSLHGAEREVVGRDRNRGATKLADGKVGFGDYAGEWDITRAATPDAQRYAGHGTAIKTLEPWLLIRKPLSESSIARNVLRWGTGALNIDGCRLPFASECDSDAIDAKHAGMDPSAYARPRGTSLEMSANPMPLVLAHAHASGRWPSALVASDLDVTGPVAGVRVIGEGGAHVAGVMRTAGMGYHGGASGFEGAIGGDGHVTGLDGVLGAYTRHFRIPGTDGDHDEAIPSEVETLIICAKASTAEREEGLDGFDVGRRSDGRHTVNDSPRLRDRTVRRNVHPTVKPVALMRHLVRLVTPPGGTCLDVFTGSGSTGVAAVWEGFDFIGCELNDSDAEPFVRIARARITYAERTPPPEQRCRAPKAEADERQVEMFGETGT